MINIRHPEYDRQFWDWQKWQYVYEGGEEFINQYLKKFSKREETEDFSLRKTVTPIPAFAKSSINEIKNSIFQRLVDVTRTGGPDSYERACRGLDNGVDMRGSTMNWFLGHNIIPELLVKKKVGVYVDNVQVSPTLANKKGHPYFYHYKAQDILSWGANSVFLREHIYVYENNLPKDCKEIYRHVYINSRDFVQVDFYNEKDIKEKSFELKIRQIPFKVFEITESLMKDVANHQIALLNMESSDVSYSLKANFPFYTEQFNSKGNSKLIKEAQKQFTQVIGDVTECETVQNNYEEHLVVGASEGRRYAVGLERPGFIHPSSEPLRASMDKQKELKEDIRVLVHLALSTVQSKSASADSKGIDMKGLESGLSYIGLELEHGERELAQIWALYENAPTPTVTYPKRWELKSEEAQRKEVEELEDIRDSVPSKTFQKEITKQIATVMVGAKVSAATLDKILKEVDEAPTLTSDIDTLIQETQNGMVSTATASQARGYGPEEAELAKKEHAERLARIQQAQSDPAARGNKDASVNPQASSQEKIGKPKRGPNAE